MRKGRLSDQVTQWTVSLPRFVETSDLVSELIYFIGLLYRLYPSGLATRFHRHELARVGSSVSGQDVIARVCDRNT